MIYFLVKNIELNTGLRSVVAEKSVEAHFISPESKDPIAEIYREQQVVRALVLEPQLIRMPRKALVDLLESLSKKTVVILLCDTNEFLALSKIVDTKTLNLMVEAKAPQIAEKLEQLGLLGAIRKTQVHGKIPAYNPLLSLSLLKKNECISILTIHASDFRKIAFEYGNEIYQKLQASFQEILLEIWGAAGSFRTRDLVFRLGEDGNSYCILLEYPRSERKSPPPGALERLTDRIVTKMQQLVWVELNKNFQQTMIPSHLLSMPRFTVGHATAIYNPCMNGTQTLENLFEDSARNARLQNDRIYNRQREFMQALIHSSGMLVPSFQGVFHAQNIQENDVRLAQSEKSIRPLFRHIFGFESLIRLNLNLVKNILPKDGPLYLEPRFLKPDIIFGLAATVKLSLELDQACLREAAHYFNDLPGKLMVNILPRNFYYIDELQKLIPDRISVIYEVCENEAINNFELVGQAREMLRKKNLGIAIDDFGKGYAGFDRALRLSPDIIKLDRSLVQNIHLDQPKRAFVTGLVAAAKVSKSSILAEGVELIEEMRVLQEIGVDLFQGFLFHYPETAHSLTESIKGLTLDEDQDLRNAS